MTGSLIPKWGNVSKHFYVFILPVTVTKFPTEKCCPWLADYQLQLADCGISFAKCLIDLLKIWKISWLLTSFPDYWHEIADFKQPTREEETNYPVYKSCFFFIFDQLWISLKKLLFYWILCYWILCRVTAHPQFRFFSWSYELGSFLSFSIWYHFFWKSIM